MRVLDNLVNGFESNLVVLGAYPAFEFMEGDIRDAETCQKACEGIDYVPPGRTRFCAAFHQRAYLFQMRSNVGGFVNMLKAAVDNKVKISFMHHRHLSTAMSLLCLKGREDRKLPVALCRYSKRPTSCMRRFCGCLRTKADGIPLFQYFRPRQDPNGPYAAVIPLFVKGIMNRTPVYINGDGEQTRDFTYVENAVQINVKGMLNENQEASRKKFIMWLLGNIIPSTTCIRIVQITWRATETHTQGAQGGDIRNSLADISLAANLLGYKPVKDLKRD